MSQCFYKYFKVRRPLFMNRNKIVITLLIILAVNVNTIDWTDQGNWGQSCNNGLTRQSPINFEPRQTLYCSADDLNIVQFACSQFTTANIELGQNAATFTAGGSVVFIDSFFENVHYRAIGQAQKIYVHSPSEHRIKGKQYDMEVYIVHTPIDPSEWQSKIQSSHIQTVTSFSKQELKDIFNDGSETQQPIAIIVGFLFQINSNVPNTNILGFDGDRMLNLKTAFECTSTRFFYRYSGSYTIPPCTERVQYLIARDPIKISQQQFDMIKSQIAQPNNRNMQDANGRIVRLAGPPCHPSDGTA